MNLNEFRDCVRQEFRFLIEDYDYAEVPLPDEEFINEFMVCFSNGRTWIGIEGINWGFAIDVRLASVDPTIMRYPDYCLGDLLAMRHPAFEPITAKGTDTRDIQKRQLNQFAEELRIHAADVLRGKFDSFPQLAKAIDDRQAAWEREVANKIGIGVSLAAEPLPHHPACGSAPGGSFPRSELLPDC